jgi:hypothetical protein
MMGCTRATVSGLIAAVYLCSLTGCAGNGNGLDANGRPLAPDSGGPVPLSADFNSIQQNIFTPICSVCHVGGGAPQGLRLDAANSYNLLVGVPSTEVPSIERVKPGDPNNSYIIQKLEGHAAVGAQMPFGGPYLSTSTIAFIRQWITDGAQPSTASTAASIKASATAATDTVAVVTSAPATGDILAQSPPQIMIGFNHDLDFTRVDANTARLQRLAPGQSEAPVPARLATVSVNPRVILLWPSDALVPGRYQIVVSAPQTTAVVQATPAVVATFDVGATR